MRNDKTKETLVRYLTVDEGEILKDSAIYFKGEAAKYDVWAEYDEIGTNAQDLYVRAARRDRDRAKALCIMLEGVDDA